MSWTQRWRTWRDDKAMRETLFPAVGLILLAVLWLTTWQLIRVESDAAEKAVVDSSRELAETYEAHVVRALREIDQTLKVVKLAVEDPQSQSPLQLLRARDLLPSGLLFQIDVFDAAGRALESSAQSSPRIDIADDRLFIEQGKVDEFVVGLPVQEPGGNWRLSFSRRLEASDGAFAGIVVLTVDAAYFVSAYEPAKLGQRGTLAAVGEDGVFRARRVADEVTAGGTVDIDWLLADLDDNDTATQLAVNPWDGERRYLSARRLYRYPFVVLVGLSADEHLAAAERDVRRYLMAAAAASLIFLLVIAWMARMDRRLRESERLASQARVAMARQAGMAEIATNVLHNVGNVLNSVNVSAELVMGTVRHSKLGGLRRAVQMLEQNQSDLGRFITEDAKGRLLPNYFSQLAAAWEEERGRQLGELELLTRSIDHIKEIIATQQNLAGKVEIKEPVKIDELVDEAVRMQRQAIDQLGIELDLRVAPMPLLTLDRHRLLSVLINLIKNAKDAIAAARVSGAAGGRIAVVAERGEESPQQLHVQVIDDGEGFDGDIQPHLFEHGFSTRGSGRGYGLHSCALAIAEMGGTLQAKSEGRGRGATFLLQIPVEREQAGDE